MVAVSTLFRLFITINEGLIAPVVRDHLPSFTLVYHELSAMFDKGEDNDLCLSYYFFFFFF